MSCPAGLMSPLSAHPSTSSFSAYRFVRAVVRAPRNIEYVVSTCASCELGSTILPFSSPNILPGGGVGKTATFGAHRRERDRGWQRDCTTRFRRVGRAGP